MLNVFLPQKTLEAVVFVKNPHTVSKMLHAYGSCSTC